jgi:drug/metabolite transporter (DMT)-like permease
MQLIGALCTGALLAWPPARPPHASPRLLLLAAGLGLINMAGGALLYRALEVGTVSLVSPVSSTFAAIAAALAIAAGERPGALQLFGLLVTVAGVVGASIPPRPSGTPPASRRGLGLAGLAAIVWGVGFFSLRYVVKDLGGLFPVFVARAAATAAIAGLSTAQRANLSAPRGAWALVAGVAICDSAAFVFYNLGIAGDLTSVVSILSSLFSAVTVLLAMLFLRERLGRLQWLSVAVILAGVGMVSGAG